MTKLTDEEIRALIDKHDPDGDSSGSYAFARAVEQAVEQRYLRKSLKNPQTAAHDALVREQCEMVTKPLRPTY